jgi:hypothetical protein
MANHAYRIDPQTLEGSSNMATDGNDRKDLATQLGELIRKLNPYTNKQNRQTGQSTGEMQLFFDNTEQSSVSADSPTILGVEMEGPYRQEWTFKGQPQRVGMAARIKYRYPVQDSILVGFAGGMGG